MRILNRGNIIENDKFKCDIGGNISSFKCTTVYIDIIEICFGTIGFHVIMMIIMLCTANNNSLKDSLIWMVFDDMFICCMLYYCFDNYMKHLFSASLITVTVFSILRLITIANSLLRNRE